MRMFRMAVINFQGISGNVLRASGDSLRAASPMISNFLFTASYLFFVRFEVRRRNSDRKSLDGFGGFENVLQIRVILPHKSADLCGRMTRIWRTFSKPPKPSSDLRSEFRRRTSNRTKKRYEAVNRKLEIIGEAARRLSPEARNTFPEIPWKLITAMRNILI